MLSTDRFGWHPEPVTITPAGAFRGTTMRLVKIYVFVGMVGDMATYDELVVEACYLSDRPTN
jgi:hypothetical protein